MPPLPPLYAEVLGVLTVLGLVAGASLAYRAWEQHRAWALVEARLAHPFGRRQLFRAVSFANYTGPAPRFASAEDVLVRNVAASAALEARGEAFRFPVSWAGELDRLRSRRPGGLVVIDEVAPFGASDFEAVLDRMGEARRGR